MSIKSALRINLSTSYVMKSITSISHLRWLSPLWCLTAPPSPRCIGRATKGKRLYGQARRLTSPDLHILCRMCTVDNKALKGSLYICDSTVSTGYSAPACGGKVVAPATKGGMHFRRPQGGCMVLYKLAPSINLEAPSTTLSGIAAVSRVDGIRLLCPPLTEPYVRFSRIRLLE